jgi:hypothetical protein
MQPTSTVTMGYFNSCNGTQNEWMNEARSRLHAEVWRGNTIEEVYENYDGWWWRGNILNDLWQKSNKDIQGWMKLGPNFIPSTSAKAEILSHANDAEVKASHYQPTAVLPSSALLAVMNQHKAPVTNRVQWTGDLLKQGGILSSMLEGHHSTRKNWPDSFTLE